VVIIVKVIKNVRIYDFNKYIENGYVIFDEQIHEVGSMAQYKANEYEEIDGSNALLMPGLVNGHSHIYSTFARGMSAPFNPKTFKELLEQLWWKLDRYLNNEMTYYSGIVSGIEYIKNGVTTIVDHHASGEIIGSLHSLEDALDKVGMRKVLCFETSDRFDIDHCIQENLDYIKTSSSTSSGLFGLHASFTLSDQTLNKVSRVLNGSPIHIHVAESIEDQIDSLTKHKKRVIHRLNDFNLINKNSIITHGLYLEDGEFEIIKEKEAVIALNVSSNMNNAVGLPDYMRMKENGIKVIIGNDGISQKMTSEYQNLYFSMHHKSESPIAFTMDDLQTIINNTYTYVSDILGTKLGKIEPGFVSDFVLLPYNEPTPLNKDNIFGHLFFGLFNHFRPIDVYVGGNKIVENYNVSKSLQSEFNKAKESAKLLWDKIEKEGTI
jgi:putative selenium metabolism protein SsnA